jgi:hypothetical protein
MANSTDSRMDVVALEHDASLMPFSKNKHDSGSLVQE